MLKAQVYKEGSTVAGAVGALLVEQEAPWVGIVKSILVNFLTTPAEGELLTIYHQNKNGLVAWRTPLWQDDPALCPIDGFSFLAPVGLQAGDSIIVEYPNSAKVAITCSITLETS